MSQMSVTAHLIWEALYLKYGYDFRGYSPASLNRRLEFCLSRFAFLSETELLVKLLDDPTFIHQILPHLTITTTELFRSPDSFRRYKESIFPVLKTYPSVNIWIAGCSSGEEIYSLAILLHEEGLLERSTIYATDINPEAIKRAQQGIYSSAIIPDFVKNYTAAGGQRQPSDYYSTDYDLVRFKSFLKENVVFSEHNLATDEVFVQTHLVLCRNVLIYFEKELQDRALNLFAKSLIQFGFLGLGDKESLSFSSSAPYFTTIDARERVFKRNSLALMDQTGIEIMNPANKEMDDGKDQTSHS